MMRYLPYAIIFAAILTGCSAAVKYDFDVTCSSDPSVIVFVGETKEYSCSRPDKFSIKCKYDTIQMVNDSILCTTHDGKSVRIRIQNTK